MILIDTSIWIEYFKGKNPVFSHVARLLEEDRAVTVEPVFGELLQGARNERERHILQEFWINLPKIDHQDLFIDAGVASSKQHWFSKGGGLIDAVIITAARASHIPVWTVDKKLLSILKKSERYRL